MTAKALFGVGQTFSGGHEVLVWKGLASVSRGLFKANKLPFTISGTFAGPGEYSVVGKPGTDPAVTAFVAAKDGGLIRYEEGAVSVLRLIVQICVALATSKMVVIVRTKKDAGDLSRLLNQHRIFPVIATSGGLHDDRHRVVITTLGLMGSVEISKADLVLVADALYSTWDDPLTAPPVADPNEQYDPDTNSGAASSIIRPGKKATGLMERLVRAEKARVFGFLPRSRQRSPFEIARCWQIYGPAELVVPRHGCVERPVMVGLFKFPMSESKKDSVVYLKNKIRMHPIRNRLVGSLARALQTGNKQELRRILPSLGRTNIAGTPQHVLVLVESLKQALALGSFLPHWPVVSGLGDDDRDIKVDVPTITRGVIVTALGIEKLTGSEFDVIVRADPGESLPCLPSGWLRTNRVRAKKLIVIDVDDTGHHPGALWSQARRRSYRAAGWGRLGEDPDITAWEKFRIVVLRGEGQQ